MSGMIMKIMYLHLVNFECIMSGLHRSEITLDLSNTEHAINVFVGKIGSGKTFILSHLQPFATLGTLDIRNQDDQIIVGEDGVKEIWYDTDQGFYKITHNYIWSKNSHTTKSFITKDEEELNPSGNVSSFKYIIMNEFGLDPSYLRLLRIGANVTGLLELSATERKAYVASLLERADIILALNKKFREELRNYNAQMSVLLNKLNQISDNGKFNLEQAELEIETVSDVIHNIETRISELNNSIIKLEAEINLIAPKGYEAYQSELQILIKDFDKNRNERDQLQLQIAKLEGNKDVPQLAKEIGRIEVNLSNCQKDILSEQDTIIKLKEKIRELQEKILVIQNDSHIQILKETASRLSSETDQMWNQIKDFKCDYNSDYLKNLITELHNIDILINDVAQYDHETIYKLYMSDSSIIKWSRDKGEILTGRKINLQKRINNLNYSASYSPTGPMYTPPFCPTKDCPFKKTHPYTLSKDKTKSEINEEVEVLRNEIEKIDKELYMYAEYPVIYTKITSVNEKIKSAMPILKSIGCLLTENVLLILTRLDKRKWYDYDKIIDTQELALIKESYYERVEQLHKVKQELASYNDQSVELMKDEIERLTDQLNTSMNHLQDLNNEYDSLSIQQSELNDLYRMMLEKASYDARLSELNQVLNSQKKEMESIAKNLDKIAPYAMVISNNKNEIDTLTKKLNEQRQLKNKLEVQLTEIKHTQEDIENVELYQKYLTLIVNATSSKEGIPLKLIDDFVSGCKDTVNDLTFDIFEDDILLEDFQLDEKEFYVPYTINGKYVQDVTKASQGQRSLFGIAIAFAFAQEAKIKYNIPLLDEVDGPLHKNEHGKFLSMVLRQMKRIGSHQLFMITHSVLEGIPVNYICTTEEDLNLQNGSTMIKLYE